MSVYRAARKEGADWTINARVQHAGEVPVSRRVQVCMIRTFDIQLTRL